jgi:glycosyltransferase involved in cell wall biosynthesis
MQAGKVAIVFNRIGPYHYARLRAAARVCDLIAIQGILQDETYAWNTVEFDGKIPVQTLFSERETENQTLRELARRFTQTMRQIRPEVLLVPGWSSPLALISLNWCCRNRIPAVLMSESTAWDKKRGAAKEWIKQRVVALFSTALAGGTPQLDYLKKLGMPTERVFLGYDAVDNDYFRSACDKVRTRGTEVRQQFRLPPKYFLASARFVEKKNLPRLLEAYTHYRKQNPKSLWHLVLLGDGPLKKKLESLVNELGLHDCVHFPGFKQYSVLPAYYGLAGAFVHASTTEQWGLVVNEAMASGLPILVSARCGCALDLVRNGINGFTFDPFSVDHLAACLANVARLDEQGRLRMGAESQRLIAPWGLERFADGFGRAAHLAASTPTLRSGFLSRLLLAALLLK